MEVLTKGSAKIRLKSGKNGPGRKDRKDYSSSRQPKNTAIDFQVISCNLIGLVDDRTRKKIIIYLKKQLSGDSVIFMQEIHSTSKS